MDDIQKAKESPPKLRKRAPGGGRKAAPKSGSVRAIRLALGMTQEKMAARLGCTFYAIQKIERESRLPSNADIIKKLKRASIESGIPIEILPDDS